MRIVVRAVRVRRPAPVPRPGRGGARGRRDDPPPRGLPRRRHAGEGRRPRRRPAWTPHCGGVTPPTTSSTAWTTRTSATRTPRPPRPSPRPRRAGLQRIVYLGGLGDDADDLSSHLRSRREVEKLLSAGGVPVTTLRAGIIVGHGGISWEMTRQLVEHLPAMITPRWVRTRTQPIAVADVVRYLVGILDRARRGLAGLRHRRAGRPGVRRDDARVARIEGRTMLVVPVPLLTPSLSSRWLSLVTTSTCRPAATSSTA